MNLDRELQRQILQIASTVYPRPVGDELDELYEPLDDLKLAANLKYLEQHRLISPNSLSISMDGMFSFGPVLITHTGMDFLADDGGLSSILGTVIIKFETEQLKAILTAKIMSSDLSLERKTTMIEAIKELPAEGLKHLTTKIVDVGWENLDSLMALIQRSIS
ncbi:hypothetical protein P7L54_04960 [Acinetobacter bereziniae]|jgi:hypothetical protein|uniref:hypothetical protein n=1 Tax=Acinetobacter bereziniae TaxID=106648 RepID=UPI0019041368|nr:hypothetical protein [Acinetobacter bereziniae]MDG3555299.1 hypothetical protein [Acinetobacter bereziniae]QQC81437.1 hypothetical protein I9192_04895 [Acinetobacter bereziniae]UUN94548.1 hypothetical protein I9189_004915 [Acinetobacter bereziniae]WMW75611.1 hypothetical protein RG306_04870 [Acinetobacter bereziniae]